MLTKQDNELLTRVGPGTPTGDLLRQYWLPAFLSWEVETDRPPMRVRLLGEDLVAFRDTLGRVGLVANNCPHRGASLFFGRNEEEGLRCVYHGWKFDLTGACVDMPNEPPESNFKHKIHHTAYPCRERKGVVWAYMGPRNDPPALPEIPWNILPESHVHISMRMQMNNWAQAVEGGIDSSHISFLHSWLKPEERPVPAGANRAAVPLYASQDKHPVFETLDTNAGVIIGARRNAEEDSYYWRITQFLMPFYSMIPGSLDPIGNVGGHCWIPLDDEHTMTWSITCNHSHPITQEEHGQMSSYPGGGINYGRGGMKPATSQFGGKWIPELCRENDFGLDWELMKNKLFFGIEQFGTQDSAIQETMGRVFDRSREHLGSADTGVIRFRRSVIAAATALRDNGTTPPGVDTPEDYWARSASLVLPRTADWTEASKPALIPAGTTPRE